MERVKLPLISMTASPRDAFKTMKRHRCSAVVATKDGKAFMLYDLKPVLQGLRDGVPALRNLQLGEQVHALTARDAMSHGLDMFNALRSYRAFESFLDASKLSYTLVGVGMPSAYLAKGAAREWPRMAMVVTRHEHQRDRARARPITCRCSKDPDRHVWEAYEVTGGQACQYGDGGIIRCP